MTLSCFVSKLKGYVITMSGLHMYINVSMYNL